MPKRLMMNHGRIIASLSNVSSQASADKLSRGKQFYYFCNHGERKVFLIMEGDFIVRSENGNKIINIISAPYVIGALPSIDPPPIWLEKVGYGRIYAIEYHQFWCVVDKKELRSDVMAIISAYHSDLLDYLQIASPDSEQYTLNLIRKWNSFPCHIKKRFSLLFFLTNSSFLSKSTASRTLKKLKDEGVIKLDKGRLSTISNFTAREVSQEHY